MPSPQEPDGKDNFRLNEPAKQIPGGSVRKSVLVSREQLPAVRQRERVNQVLLAHDLHDQEAREALLPEDFAILREIARSGAITNIEPALRYNAILMLGSIPTVEHLNLLDELAHDGEDVYVRSHALIALANTGLRLAYPTLCEGLASRVAIESLAAEKAMAALGRSLGVSAVRQLLKGERRARVREKIERVLAGLTSAQESVRQAARRVTAGGER